MQLTSLKNDLDYLNVISHPVHLIINGHKRSQSAFIPFCDFGGNMSSMGVKVEQFDVAVCNSFQAKILNDQLCYEVDLNKFSNKHNREKELEMGFNFIMDYNEDRQDDFQPQIDFQQKDRSIGDILGTVKKPHS